MVNQQITVEHSIQVRWGTESVSSSMTENGEQFGEGRPHSIEGNGETETM